MTTFEPFLGFGDLLFMHEPGKRNWTLAVNATAKWSSLYGRRLSRIYISPVFYSSCVKT